ncbi:hypothetical protein DPMN_065173 [Dreissena polymorpha]|uniref:Uncharacterized protein n=1 Tax=Dreissena polymorpha TaxID=45954 RepID=A0A9D4CDK7_DREPO|nr:hypothetical protein DPMN_065173 [Dreissena polymorpha]
MSAPCWLKKVSPIYIPMSGQHRAVLHSRSRADIHTNVGPTSSRVALPISGRCNYRCRADIHTDSLYLPRFMSYLQGTQTHEYSISLLWKSSELQCSGPNPDSRESNLKNSYLALVRSKLKYASVVWDQLHQTDIDRLERVQFSAAMFITIGLCHRHASKAGPPTTPRPTTSPQADALVQDGERALTIHPN